MRGQKYRPVSAVQSVNSDIGRFWGAAKENPATLKSVMNETAAKKNKESSTVSSLKTGFDVREKYRPQSAYNGAYSAARISAHYNPSNGRPSDAYVLAAERCRNKSMSQASSVSLKMW